MGKNVTIYTIAKEAGVSASTVSRYLTGSANVNEDKRVRIQQVIDKYGFRPSAIARNLSTQETKMLGFIMPDVTSPFYGTVFIGAEKQAIEYGYTLVLCNTNNDNIVNNTRMELKYIETLLEKQVDGLIMIGGHIDDLNIQQSYVDKLSKLLEDIPTVMINGEINGLDCYKVKANESLGLHALINYLVSLKHKKIGFIGGISNIQPTLRRLNIIKEALAENNLEFNDDWFIEDDFSIDAGKKCLEQLLQMKEKPTAVVCVNDLVAIGFIYAAKQFGLKIPEDISVAGVDNIYLSRYTIPNITTVDLNPRELGSIAVDVLVKHLQNQSPKKETILDTKLVIRESCISNP